ncbi:hypothetical protein SAMN06313486_10610 [Epsilonproteobacteria bacterium SCGC AD-308-P11]|jgi:hypothetical protein|nr:hypothetical protein SAMN06313486_10610 [Epsilonproteobacteria bacterium SCGC AD-308-P11]
MLFHDAIIILVMTFPMFLFTIFPGIKLANYLEERYQIDESYKRVVMVSVTFLFALILSTLLYYI